MPESSDLSHAARADLVLRGGRVLPLPADPATSAPEGASLAVRDGRILGVSARADAFDALIGAQTRVVDARGLTVIPGFFDSHNHQLSTAHNLDAVQLAKARSIADILKAIGEAAAAAQPGDWIRCSPTWHETLLAERRLPRADELDRVAPRNPVYLPRGGHVVVTNSEGLRRAGLRAEQADPPGGSLIRDASGRLTGTLLEPPAFAPLIALLPEPDQKERVEQLARGCALYNARGITAVRDPGINRDELAVYQRCEQAGRLSVRSIVMLRMEPSWPLEQKIDALKTWPTPNGSAGLLRAGGVKLWLDGGVEAAALESPYANDPSFTGHLFEQPQSLVTVVEAALARGLDVGCHAVGEKAIDAAIQAYDAVLRRDPSVDPRRLVVEHASLANPRHIEALRRLGLTVTVQFPLLYFLAGNMLVYWGEERTERTKPLRDLVDGGVFLAAGSDSPVNPFDPLLALWGAVSRQTAVAGRRGVDQALTRLEALRLGTTAGARLWTGPHRRDGLLPGRLADITALPLDPLTCELDALPESPVALTVTGGRVVHDPEGRTTRSDGRRG
ncbi:MAG TPA: amidohydrolase [Candidatus Limnocylindrales bacterium]|nr:amidohydrolase [Candidatus Limnocylindrales bacterium]